jgi:hypothetical protein
MRAAKKEGMSAAALAAPTLIPEAIKAVIE